MSLVDVTQADACIEVQGSTIELRIVEETETNLESQTTSEDCAEIVKEKNREIVCNSIAALQKAGALQRFVEKHTADLRESCVKAADFLLNPVCHTPLQSGQKRATLEDMLRNSS